MIRSENDHQPCLLPFTRIAYRPAGVQHQIYRVSGGFFLLVLSILGHAQPNQPKPVSQQAIKTQRVDKERLRAGYQTQITGWVVHQNDTLQLGRGSRPGKEFAFLYQPVTFSPSVPARRKYLTAAYSGRKAVLKTMTAKEAGVESGLYVLLAIEGLPLYRGNLDRAINAGEILPPIRYRPSAQSSPAVPVIVARGLIKLQTQLKAGQISQSEFEAKKKKLLE